MRLAQTATGERQEASPAALGTCPACLKPVRPKCGPIVTWHWAHHANDCDPWAEPETQWHLQWKRHGFQSEVVMRQGAECHRADVVTPTGLVIELQSGYLDLPAITARERFYRRMVWLYRVHWQERVHLGARGFWWKHGSKAMAQSARPIYWDLGDEIWQVSLGLVDYDTRVVGRIRTRIPPTHFAHWIHGGRDSEARP